MTTERIRANGLDFAYLVEGRGPLVMLLHGFPDTAHTWDRTMTELARAGYRAVAPFMRGYHPTEIPKAGPFDIDTACAYYAAIPLSATPPASAKLPIKVPAVAFVGADDHQMRLSMFEKARPCFESSYEVIEVPGGHFMPREHPDRVIGVKEHG